MKTRDPSPLQVKKLACGEIGEGALADPADIVRAARIECRRLPLLRMTRSRTETIKATTMTTTTKTKTTTTMTETETETETETKTKTNGEMNDVLSRECS